MIYFDNSATTAPHPSVIEKMTAVLSEDLWGNPSSTHGLGIRARAILEENRRLVAHALGIRRESEGRVIFTSSGTEADQLAIFGSVYAKRRVDKNGSRGKILTTDSEHPAVEECMKRLEADGFTVCRAPTRGGMLDMNYIRENAPGAILASFMLVNNESGALYDVKTAFATVRALSPDCVTHTDAVQGFGKVRFTPAQLGADMVTVSAHKIGGPKGIGALAVAAPIFKARRLIPITPGGGQEDGFRGGTENMPGIAGFGEACRLSAEQFAENAAAVKAVREAILGGLAPYGDALRVNTPVRGIDHVISLTVFGIRSETLLNYFSEKGFCISAGSACSARSRNISRAMTAFGLTDKEADATVRVSLSPSNTVEEAKAFTDAMADALKLQHFS
jgi:cysteine desulfurase